MTNRVNALCSIRFIIYLDRPWPKKHTCQSRNRVWILAKYAFLIGDAMLYLRGEKGKGIIYTYNTFLQLPNSNSYGPFYPYAGIPFCNLY